MFNDLDKHARYCYVRCRVLPSMKKTRAAYDTRVCLQRDGFIHVAYCVCTAGLAGCCNHVAALLYALEEFVRLGLREEADSPTSRLCTWNRPRARTVAPCKVEDVRLHRAKFRQKKRQRGPKARYNPVPPNKRLLNPAEMDELRVNLAKAHEHALATSGKKKTATLTRYGPSTWQTALADTSASSSEANDSDGDGESGTDLPTPLPHLLNGHVDPEQYTCEEFHEKNVVVSADEAKIIERRTQEQASCDLWHTERRKRVTATLFMKIVSRRWDDYTTILCEKLSGSFRGNVYTMYGQTHEAQALNTYVSSVQARKMSWLFHQTFRLGHHGRNAMACSKPRCYSCRASS